MQVEDSGNNNEITNSKCFGCGGNHTTEEEASHCIASVMGYPFDDDATWTVYGKADEFGGY